MAWPPPSQPNNFGNSTPQNDTHPIAHVDLANTLNNDFAPQVESNRSGLGAVNSRVDEHEFRYPPSGQLKLSNPEIWSDAANIARKDAAGNLYSYLDGIRNPISYYEYVDPLLQIQASWGGLGVGVEINPPDGAREAWFLVNGWAQIYNLSNGNNVEVQVAQSIDYDVTVRSGSYGSGWAVSDVGSGATEARAMAVCGQTFWFVDNLQNISSIRWLLEGQRSSGTPTIRRGSVSVVPFWR